MSAVMPTGPRWVAVRQHRRALWVLAAAIAVSFPALVALRLLANRPTGALPRSWQSLERSVMDLASTGMLFLPLLAGAFVAGPMVAREWESGTHRLALTQSTSPRAWLASKVVVAAAVWVVAAALFIGVYRFGWSRVADTYGFSWADRGPYEATGPVLVAYGLLAIALGAVVGQLVRRTVPAMAVTGLVTGLVMLVMGHLRWSLVPVRTVATPFSAYPDQQVPSDAFLRDAGFTTGSGGRLPGWICFERSGDAGVCPADLDIVGRYADFHPHAHYWWTQLVEGSIVLVLAAAAGYAAFRILRGRYA
ncbi:hypothetical protein GCM10010371_65460 [Streptomyces subrutilus]|uniref:ABC transporter permease n=1 Tax=Streptomyces subrutilus TaxID=36818 RepID=A0A5P2UDM3_9ACTN|nr:ABC transporter permease [Streptomyces subrutilus]QEU77048.1 ABC transporter permease [Streptomyces subrutilus]GGZ96368.1 hypothetical protein GCM10010371_65460 [Streptomyces subrutilus]